MEAKPDPGKQKRSGVPTTFATTHWSVVLAANSCGDSSRAADAMETLCRTYWYPLYVYVRGCGYSHQDAQDLTQGFFAHVLRKEFLARVSPERGRFRSFLLACMKHYLADEWKREHAAKRGGPGTKLSLDSQEAERRYQLEDRMQISPDRLFDRRWAIDLLHRVLDQLRQEAAANGRIKMFDQLRGHFVGDPRTETYAGLGERLGMTESALRVAVHRMRRRYAELLRAEIAHTVSRPEEIEEELNFLFEAVSD